MSIYISIIPLTFEIWLSFHSSPWANLPKSGAHAPVQECYPMLSQKLSNIPQHIAVFVLRKVHVLTWALQAE